MAHLRLVAGTIEEIEGALAAAVAAARADDPLALVTVVVGHVLLRPYLRRALARRGIAQINVRFVLPHELAADLARGTDGGKPRLTPPAERLLVRDVAEQAGGYFAHIRHRDGFAAALLRLFREIELGGFTPASFASACGEAAGARHANAAKLRELARLFALYEERREGFIAPADQYRAADVSGFEGPLLVYGLRWSPQEMALSLIDAIAQNVDVTLFLPASGLPADDAHAGLRARVVARGAVVERAGGALPSGEDAPPALARALFDAAAAPVSHERIELVSAPDTVREVWEAARACLRWASAGIRFYEMAVVYRNADPYRALVDEIFSEAGIETYLHEGRLLAAHPLGRRVLSLLDLAADEKFPRAKVMEFLTETEIAGATAKKYGRVRPSEWETYTREAGVVEGAAEWDARLARLAAEKREHAREEGYEWLAEVAERVDVLRGFAADFADALAEHPAEASWEEHLRYLRSMASRYAAGVEPIIDALDDLKVLEAVTSRVTFETFCRAVRDDLESRDASRVIGEPVRSFGRQGVTVIDATSVRHLRFRAVYMLGVAERAWPPPPRPDPLLLEHERSALNRAGGGALPLRTEPDEEPLGFWLGAQSATEHLAISYARADASHAGRHLPSYFFRAVLAAIGGGTPGIDEVECSALVRRIAAGRLASDELSESVSTAEYDRTLVHVYVSGRGDATGVRALARLSTSFGRAIEARSARWSAALTPFDGCMVSPDAVAAARDRSPFARGDAVSPSRLETYAECPYRYFLRYGLRIEPVEEPEAIERLDNLERGSLIHAIFERFMREVCPDDPPSAEARERHIRRLLEIAREEGHKREQLGVTGKPLIWRIDQRQILEDLVRWYDYETSDRARLVPHGFEVAFGPVQQGAEGIDDPLSSAEPLVIMVEGREIRLQGRIDRIDHDTARTRFRVIDYKTGQARNDGGLNHGRALQLPVYLHAAAKLLDIDTVRGEAQYFYATSRGEFKRTRLSGAELAVRDSDFRRVLGTIAQGVDGGFFAPHPGAGRINCRYCDYKDICDARIDRVMQKKRDDPRAAAYIALEEIK